MSTPLTWPKARLVLERHLRTWTTGPPVVRVYRDAACLLERVRDELLAADAGWAIHAVVAWRSLFSALEERGLVAANPARLVLLPRPRAGRISSHV